MNQEIETKHLGEKKVHAGFWWGNLRKEKHLEDLGVDGRIIFKWIFRKWNGGHGLDLSGSV
jgi:hypothetical protein